MTLRALAPLRDEPFMVDEKVSLPAQTFFEDIDACLVEINASIVAIELRLDELEPQYIPIDATDSPYAAANNDYILVDMSLGSVIVTLPASGRLSISREGGSNTLTLTGTVNGTVNPTIPSDDDGASIAFIGTEWRWV